MGFRTIEELCAELEEKRSKALTGGGKDAVEKQKSKGKGTARERIAQLLDPGSFVEIDEFVTHRCNNFGLDERKILGDGVRQKSFRFQSGLHGLRRLSWRTACR